MPDLKVRSSAIEIMDDLNCSGAVVSQTLIELEFINKWLGGNAVTINGLRSLLKKSPRQTILIADLGCGSGDMLRLISKKIFRNTLEKKFIGIDANPNIIEYAKQNISGYPEIEFKAIDILSEEFKSTQYDIITATLFFHHFTSDQLIEIFGQLKKQASTGIVINDLHRNWLAYYSIKILTQLFSKSVMVKYDAPLSVLRGFSRKELEEILIKSGIKNYSLQWKWAFRWQLIIRTD